ncbi:pentapeptide repeat-containing protein (plasmid) [Sinorhizobium meliloti]|nr:pentapeptide repeat-containing protein [Sinorhizobium meliloti]
MFDRLRAICDAKTDNLSDLADIASPDDPAFFDGAQFSGADLRDTDLTRFHLSGALLKGAEIDDKTVLPDSTALLDLVKHDDDKSHVTSFVHTFSSIVQAEVISSLEELERRLPKQQSSNIKGPVSRRSLDIPNKNENDRTFRYTSIRKMKSIAADIVTSAERDVTIGGLLSNMDRLVALIHVCEAAMRRSEQRMYRRISTAITFEISKLGLVEDSQSGHVLLTRPQWKEVLTALTSEKLDREYIEVGIQGGSAEILGQLMIKLFVLLEQLKDVYLSLPADHGKVDTTSFEIHNFKDTAQPEVYHGRSYVM